MRVLLLADEETPTAGLIEQRLRNVRQLYALDFILRVPEVAGTELMPIAALLLNTDENADLDPLIPIELQIRAAGTGSFWADFFVQIPSYLPGTADLKQWAEWLKNAHDALMSVAAIFGMVRGWLKKYAGKKAPGKVTQQEDPDSPISQIMKRIDESEKFTEDQKDVIRKAILSTLQTFEPMALQKSIKVRKHPIRFRPS